MKLTLVTETYPPEINGVSMTLGRLVDGLRERNVEVTVVAPRRKDRMANSVQSGILQVPGLPLPRYPELRFGLPHGAALKRLWKESPPDIVHVATEGPLGWRALILARKMRIPVVSSFHTNFHSYGSHYGFGIVKPAVLRWLRYIHNRSLMTFAPSLDLIGTLEQQGFRNLRLFSRGVDTKLFGPHRRSEALRATWGASPDTPVAIHVGRLASEKNLELVIRAYQLMRAMQQNLKLVLVGDGPERRAAGKALPEAYFAGMREGTDLAAHFASADCFLFASLTETFGNVVTEAMASGLPVLAFDYAAPGRFVKQGESGFLAPFNDENIFLEQAESLIKSRPRWALMGASARKQILPYSWDKVIDAYLEDIRSIHPTRTPSQYESE